MANTPETVSYDLIPVPHAATVELGRDRDCPRKCKACSFNETPLQKLSTKEVLQSMDTLSKYWDDVAERPDFQLVGARFVEFLGIAGAMENFKREDLRKILESAEQHDLAQIAFMADAFMDGRAIKDFFELHARAGMARGGEDESGNARETGDGYIVAPYSRGVIALSVDTLPMKNPVQGRQLKSTQSWDMLAHRNEFIRNPEKQNFRAFTTMSKSNLKDIPQIAAGVLEGGNLLFVAPITAHTPEALAKTKITGKLLMGSDTSDLLTEEDLPLMERVVEELRALKQRYPAQFLNGEANFQNMLYACKPLMESFRNNCRESCKFTLEGGEVLNCTPNIRVVKKPGDKGLSLATCTCFVGLTGNGEHYADTSLDYLAEAGKDPRLVIDMYRKLTCDLIVTNCGGCLCRTALDLKKGGLK